MKNKAIFDHIVSKERSLKRTATLLFGEETARRIGFIFDEQPVRTGIERLLSHFESSGGALPSHNFAHAVDVATFAIGAALQNSMNEEEHLIDLGLAALYDDSVRFYKDGKEEDSVLKEVMDKTDSENKDSCELSAGCAATSLRDVRGLESLAHIIEMIVHKGTMLGTFIDMADVLDMGEPFRESATAIEHRIARNAGWRWVEWKYKREYYRRLDSLGSKNVETLERYQKKLLNDLRIEGRDEIPGITRGLITVRLEAASLSNCIQGMLPFGLSPHPLRKECLLAREEMTKTRLVTLAWRYRRIDGPLSRRLYQYAKETKRIEKRIA